MSMIAQPGVIPARFFTQAGEVDEGTFWREVERLCRLGARGRITDAEVTWRFPAKGGPVVARLEREREGWA
jgi:hypothetical protein